MPQKVFVICPVRGASDTEKRILEDHVTQLENQGYAVHYPPRDTDQTDPHGHAICTTNRDALTGADEVHVYWNGKGMGSYFDMGMYFASEKLMQGKKLVIINNDDIKPTPHKSFENVLLELHQKYNRA